MSTEEYTERPYCVHPGSFGPPIPLVTIPEVGTVFRLVTHSPSRGNNGHHVGYFVATDIRGEVTWYLPLGSPDAPTPSSLLVLEHTKKHFNPDP